MKLKYQLRGLGIGMFITALVMGVIKTDRSPLSDAEIKARAAELGMVESNSQTLTSVGNTQSPQPTMTEEPTLTDRDVVNMPTSEPEGGIVNAPTSEPGSGTANAPTPDSMIVNTPVPESESEPTEGSSRPEAGTVIEISVEYGDSSYSVCQKLAAEGLIEDAAAFDTYLCDIGFSRKVREGVYQIPVGTSEEEIAKIITKTKEFVNEL